MWKTNNKVLNNTSLIFKKELQHKDINLFDIKPKPNLDLKSKSLSIKSISIILGELILAGHNQWKIKQKSFLHLSIINLQN
jgi:hypothetical protein